MFSKRIINKKKCICGGRLKKKINFGKLPLINLFKKNRTPKYPTIITECSSCKLIQLQKSVKDEIIYPKNYLYKSGDSADALEDFKELIQKLKKKFTNKLLNIVDVGGNDGSLMLIAKKSGERAKFKWVEDEEEGNDYFFEIKIQVDAITKDVSIMVTDFAEEDEVDEAKMLWDNQISSLKHVIGSV